MRTRLVITLLAALAAVATTGPAAATEPVHGTFWYIIDNVTAVDADAEALVWVTLPPAWDGQEVTLGAFDPAPVAILEDPSSGNRIVEWRLRPEPFAAGPAGELHQFYFRYEFTLLASPVHRRGAPESVPAYDRDDPLVKRYTAEEPGLQTDGRIRDLALHLAGDDRDPYRIGRRIYGWVLDNLVFRPNGAREWDALAILDAREGNCEQFSTLFVALCRSVGIPARTLDNTWLWGGRHVFAEIFIPGKGWLPVDPTLGQLLTEGRGGLNEPQVDATLGERGIPLGDAGWLYGNAPENRLVITLGCNIHFDSPTLGREVTLRTMKPGGSDAVPDGFRLTGFRGDVVHGGFYVFGERLDEEAAHGLAHQRLANRFFTEGLDEYIEDACRTASARYLTGTQNWINLGKSYLHKGEYYKAEAAFRRAEKLAGREPRENQISLVWIHNYLGNCYDLLGERGLARAEYEQTLTYQNDFKGAARYARRFLEKPFTKD
ncbi:tetratricopeptide repeat protein [bacterium]|nr:tetratricopeptide repeat protein [bacterium]